MSYIVRFSFKTGSPNLVGPFADRVEAHDFAARWQKHVGGAEVSIQVVPLEVPRVPEECQPFETKVRALRG